MATDINIGNYNITYINNLPSELVSQDNYHKDSIDHWVLDQLNSIEYKNKDITDVVDINKLFRQDKLKTFGSTILFNLAFNLIIILLMYINNSFDLIHALQINMQNGFLLVAFLFISSSLSSIKTFFDNDHKISIDLIFTDNQKLSMNINKHEYIFLQKIIAKNFSNQQVKFNQNSHYLVYKTKKDITDNIIILRKSIKLTIILGSVMLIIGTGNWFYFYNNIISSNGIDSFIKFAEQFITFVSFLIAFLFFTSTIIDNMKIKELKRFL